MNRVLKALSVLLLVLTLVIPAHASLTPESVVAELAPGDSVVETKTVFVEPMPPMADVLFSFDLTGSMGGIIGEAKARGIEIMEKLITDYPDVSFRFGVASYMDYPHRYKEDNCGYPWVLYGDAVAGDYAYRLDQPLTSDTAAVAAAINALVQGYGGDGPQDYTRIMFESYADPAIAWREGAKEILVNFGDDFPHDCDLNEGVHPELGIWSTGGDPGRDEIMGNADDLDLQTVLAQMAAEGVVLLECHTTDYGNEYWDFWTGITGGDVYLTTSSSLVNDVVAAITDALTVPNVYGLHLEASAGFESWISTDPAEYAEVPTGESREFALTITVPDGTAPGEYVFIVSALDRVGVSYGRQKVIITVPIPNMPPDCSAAVANPALIWPPNNKMVPISILGVTDPDGDPVTITFLSIWQDEPVDTYGDGAFAPDATISPDGLSAQVRAERSGTKKVPGDGRVYHIEFAATDGQEWCSGVVQICVPHDQKGQSAACIDGGALYDSTK